MIDNVLQNAASRNQQTSDGEFQFTYIGAVTERVLPAAKSRTRPENFAAHPAAPARSSEPRRGTRGGMLMTGQKELLF